MLLRRKTTVEVLACYSVINRNPSPARETESDLVSFKIKKKLGSRKGWIIMQDDEVECEAQDALKTVVQMIREMECQVNYGDQELLMIYY